MLNNEQVMERRTSTRVSSRVAVHLRSLERIHASDGAACDIGEGGLRVMIEQFSPVNSKVTLQFQLNILQEVIELVAQIMWIRQIPYSDRYYVGLK